MARKIPQISAYWKTYNLQHNLQHLLIHLMEEWAKYLDKGFVIDAVLTDLSKSL